MDDFIQTKITQLMSEVTHPETSVSYQADITRLKLGKLSENIKQLEFTGGPADVTAYHDFYNLQIAFEHIWTELFDEETVNVTRDLIEKWIRYDYRVSGMDIPESVHSPEGIELLLEKSNAYLERLYVANPPPANVKELISSITSMQWNNLDPSDQVHLITLATVDLSAHDQAIEQLSKNPGGLDQIQVAETINNLIAIRENYRKTKLILNRSEAMNILGRVRDTGLMTTLVNLRERLNEPYKFDIFAPNSINFGILTTYRQAWKPLNYQVGELVATIPLAPKEERTYTKKSTIKKSRAEKEIEEALRIRKEDSADTLRSDAEIVNKAARKTNFKASTEGGVNTGVWNASASIGVGIDSEQESSQTKKDFREATLKAAAEYKQERKTEIEFSTAEEFEESFTGKIINPNDELPVTYLFYELQRRYEISEHIHRLTPVILVANEVPAPHQITEAWLLTHEWILRRVILDDRFLHSLNLLTESVVGDELSLEILRANLDQLTRLIEETKVQLGDANTAIAEALENLQYANTGLIKRVSDDADTELVEASRLRLEAEREEYERLKRQRTELSSEGARLVDTKNETAAQYARAVKTHFNHQTEIASLKLHIKQNIIYYMQAIWDYESPDQRFFRLYNIKVPDFVTPSLASRVEVALEETLRESGGYPPIITSPGGDPATDAVLARMGFKVDVSSPEPAKPSDPAYPTKHLVEIADIDNLLGYKGNHMIFPLKEHNYLTNYMALDYMDYFMDKIVLRDPDGVGNYTLDELISYVRGVYESFPEGEFPDALREEFRNLLKARLMDPRPETDEIVVPTDSLYIEALPGEHPLLEDFKLLHRAADVKKVHAEVRHAELENLRLAARLIAGEREDPDVEKKVIVLDGDVMPTVDADVD